MLFFHIKGSDFCGSIVERIGLNHSERPEITAKNITFIILYVIGDWLQRFDLLRTHFYS